MTQATPFHCHHCGRAYRFNADLVGRRVTCKACGGVFTATRHEDRTPSYRHEKIDDAPMLATVVQPPAEPSAPASTRSRVDGGRADEHDFDAGNAARSSGEPTMRGGQSYDGRNRVADEIDYEIFGHESQYVEITLDPGEQTVAEAGALMYMDAGIEMNTVFGDGSQRSGGLLGKALSAGKRLATGESLFMTTFTNVSPLVAKVAFGSPYPGRMIPLHLDQLGGTIICQKDAFLCGARGIEVGIAFQKRIGAGLFGGEGFILQKLTGDGIAIVHAGGTMMYRELARDETLRVDTGCLMALGPTVQYDIQFVGGLKNAFFGGEGLFLATVTGPGPVWLQSLPFTRLAGRVTANSTASGSGQGEGSLLGGLGDMLMGD